MRLSAHSHRTATLLTGLISAVLTVVLLAVGSCPTLGDDHAWGSIFDKHFGHKHVPPGQIETLNGGAWYWMRSPEQEKTVSMNLFNRYCIRCHGVDGRGVWDIPGIPDFTDVRWQNYRSDAAIVRIIIEGRGAVMPQFRGALALDEAYGIAHYLRTFVPGTQLSKPVLRNPPGQAPAAAGAGAGAGGASTPKAPSSSPPGAAAGATPKAALRLPSPDAGITSATPFAR